MPRVPAPESPRADCEWAGGRFVFPAYVRDPEPHRPDVILWLELPDGPIVGAVIVDPRKPETFSESLEAAARRPMAGPPRRPARVRVADSSLAEEIRSAFPGLPVVVSPTPELDAVVAELTEAMARAGDLEPSYLEGGRVSAETMAVLFRRAEFLWHVAPWKDAHDDQVLRVDVPALGVEGACLSILGALGQTLGFLLFPSFEGYQAFGAAAEAGPEEPAALGTPVLALDYCRGADLPGSMRREVVRHGWPVASPNAYPRAVGFDPDSTPRPLEERDIELLAAVSGALAAFFVSHGDIFQREEFTPVSVSWFDERELEVRLTAPYHAYGLFAARKPRRPSGSGRGSRRTGRRRS